MSRPTNLLIFFQLSPWKCTARPYLVVIDNRNNEVDDHDFDPLEPIP